MALVLHNAAEAAKRPPKKRRTPVPTVPGGEILIEVQPTDSGRDALQRLHKAAHAPSLVTLAAHFPPSSAPCSTRDARLVADAAKALCRGATSTHLRGLEVSGVVPSQCVDAVLSTLSLQPKQIVSCGLRYVTLDGLALSAESTRLLCGALGKCPASIIALRRCNLTDDCAIHVANLIRAHACQRDEAAWARGAISASRRVEAPSRHRRDSCPSHNEVGGLFFDFEAVRTATVSIHTGLRRGLAPASKRIMPGEGGLRALDLTHNSLGDALCDHVSQALSADQHLLALNLSNNRISAKGAQHFSSVLVDAPAEGNALLWLGLEGCKGFLSDAYASTSKALTERREKEATSSMAEADAAARQLIECWLRDATTSPPTELLIANSQRPPSSDEAAAELFARRVGTHAPSQRFRSPEELDSCLRGVRVDVADARELRAADAAVRRAAKALRRDSDCDEWAASLASSDGCVSSAAVLSGLRVLLAGSPQALIDAAARRLDALAGQAPGVRVPATEYGQALREAAEYNGDQHAAARDDAVGAVLDAIDAYVKTKGRVGLFQDIVGSRRGKARASVADLRDFLSREGLGQVKVEAATDAQDELNFVSSSRARRGTKQAQKKARLPRDAEQGDLASYLLALAGAPKRLTATQLGAALIDAKRRASRSLEVASQALALRGASTSLKAHHDLEEWCRALDPDVTGKVSKTTLIEALMSSQPALQAAGDPAKLAASLQADSILAFAGCDVDCQVDDVCRVLTESDDVGAKSLRRVAHGAGACSVLEHARKNRWTISTLTRQLRGKKDAARAPPGCTLKELRSALKRWGLTTNEEDCVDRFREMTTRKPIIVPPSPKKVVRKVKETPVQKKPAVLSLADVLTFARRVADDDAAAVSSTRLDDAVRRSRRRAATAARLREGASDLEALRAELRDRGVELDAWLEAAERVVPLSGELHPSGTLSAPAALSAADLATGLSGLMRVSEAPAAAQDALTSIVDRAVDALAAYAREPSDFPALELRELRAANARAAAVAKRARDDDKVTDAKLVDAASDRRDAVVFRVAEAIDAILERKKWRVSDLLQAAVAFDDRGTSDKCSPRALCRALRAWGLFRCRDAAEDADYARFIGEPRSISKPPPPPKRKDPFRRKKKVQPPPVEIPKPRRKPRRKAPPSRRKPPAAQAAKDAEEADLLAQLECALVTMASKISHIESKLEGSST